MYNKFLKNSHVSKETTEKFNTYANANITNVPSRFCYALCLGLKGKLWDVAVIVVSCQHSHVYFFNDTKTS